MFCCFSFLTGALDSALSSSSSLLSDKGNSHQFNLHYIPNKQTTYIDLHNFSINIININIHVLLFLPKSQLFIIHIHGPSGGPCGYSRHLILCNSLTLTLITCKNSVHKPSMFTNIEDTSKIKNVGD